MINPTIEKLIEENEIPRGLALLYLLKIYFEINEDQPISQEVITKVNFLKIVEKEGEIVKWNIPLFSNNPIIEDMSWIEEYRNLFREVKPSSIGSRTGVYTKMGKFLKNNPTVTPDQILQATEIYVDELKTGGSTQFIMNADNFISRQDTDKTMKSRLELYLELLETGATVGRDHSKNMEV